MMHIFVLLAAIICNIHGVVNGQPPEGGGPPGGGGGPPGGGPPGGGGGMQFPPCSCTQDVNYTLARYSEVRTSTALTIRTMGIPNHPFHQNRSNPNPNPVCLTPGSVTLPTNPTMAATLTDTPFGIIGVLKTGAYVYNHLAGGNVVAYHESNELFSLDTCNGHADPTCTYHYHAISKLAQCTMMVPYTTTVNRLVMFWMDSLYTRIVLLPERIVP
jgi:hypothetical protein